jgi:serine-type D-Ala-D-Ala carboxypeptidase/endopeptidase (penicillin-binding protein 4)
MRCTQVSRVANRSGRIRRQSSNPVRTLCVVAGVGFVALLGLYVLLQKTATRVNSQPDIVVNIIPRVPILSARRAPNTLSVVTRTGRVSRSFSNFAQNLPPQSCVAIDWLGTRIAAVRSARALVPASSTKLITAAVALEILKPSFTFQTNVYGSIDATGVVQDLYLVGGGDPVIIRNEYPSTEKYQTTSGTSLELLADSVIAAGVTRISGSIVGVDSRYDEQRFVDVWPTSFHFAEAGPLGALVVNDGVVLGQPLKPDNPAIAAATELQNVLSSKGILTYGAPRNELLPSNLKLLASIRSAPLTSIVQEMLVNSDNNTAELLLKEIGLVSKGSGSTTAGLDAVHEQLTKWNMNSNVDIFDGSGLAPQGRISCDVFMNILKKFSSTFPDLMAVAGESGTIREAFSNSSVSGVLRAKTGTLSGVKALVGYFPMSNSDPVMFSLLMNKAGIDNQGSYRPIWSSLAEILSKATAIPTTEQLLP